MKLSAAFMMIFMLFAIVSCASDEDEAGCVTGLDCPNGYTCIDSVCRPESSVIEDEDQDVTDISDSGSTGDTETGDSETPASNDTDSEIPDDVPGCPNNCSGFGECDPTTWKCICDDKHQGEDCSVCADGYHLEAEGDDEDGDGTVSCAPNQTCDPNPCHNNGCRVEGNTAVCTCNAASHQGGRWCERCAEGYIESSVDGKCKEDCSLKACTAPQKCGIDYETNEATCNNCDEYYSGANCTSCDIEHFCSGHATACAVEGGKEKCTCESAYTGEKCNTCANGYFLSNGSCIKNCEVNKCFKTYQCTGTSSLTGWELTATVSGHGTCNNTSGECMCDQGWLTANPSGETVECGILTVLETLNNVECTICDKNNPPSQYASSGCPLSLTGEDTSVCDMQIFTSTFCGYYGSCYYEPTGSHQLYCVCSDGYHLDNGDKYSGECVADE